MAARRVRCQIADADDEDLDADAVLDDERIGYVNCIREGDRLMIADIEIKEPFPRHGIGSELLRFVLDAADAAGFRDVWGKITADDVKKTPGLRGWYERQGFSVTDPDVDRITRGLAR